MTDHKMDDSVTKVRSCSALNTFYHETQQEISGLLQQLHARDAVVTDLRARLSKYEYTCVAEGEQQCTLGPSKSLIESLCKEICKLKQKLKEAEADAAHKLESSKGKMLELQQKLRETEQELEAIRQRPDHEKEREIQRLRSSLADRERVQATRDVLCNSLAEEAEQLRTQLGATVRVCQGLLGRLEKETCKVVGIEHIMQVNENQMTESSEVSRLNDVVLKLKEENKQLKQRVAHVENLNSKWQKYDLSREEYVRGLCQKLKESSALQVSGAAGNTALYQKEISRLNSLLEEKMMENERLSRERDECTQRSQEHIQMLEQQVLAYIEDFKSERADRERAQGKILDLQDEVERLQLQIHSQTVREAPLMRRLPLALKKPSRKQTDSAEPLLRSSPPDSSSKRSAASTPAQGSTELQCPRCLTTYDEKHTVEYMNHCEECARL